MQMVEVEIDPRLSARENAVRYFEEAKKMKAKAESVRKAIADTERKVAEEEKKDVKARAEAEAAKAESKKVTVKEPVKKEWFERFRWFTTSGGFLAIGGRDAKQNEVIVARHMDAADLFFHADIHGAPATVLKVEGKEVGEQDLKEAAQFAASYSAAWKEGYGSVDVYCVEGSQVSKYSHGEFVPKGGFIISGQRKWFRNTSLGLALVVKDGKGVVIPSVLAELPPKAVLLVPGALDRAKAAESIKSRLGIKVDVVLPLLPSGGLELK